MSITFLLLLFAVIAFGAAAVLALPRLTNAYWAVAASVGLLLWALASLLQTSPR